MLLLNSWRVSVVPCYVTILTIQLFKNSIDTQEKLRLNLYSLSVSVSELLEYRRMMPRDKFLIVCFSASVSMTGQKQILTELKSSRPVILTGNLSPVILSPVTYRPENIFLFLVAKSKKRKIPV